MIETSQSDQKRQLLTVAIVISLKPQGIDNEQRIYEQMKGEKPGTKRPVGRENWNWNLFLLHFCSHRLLMFVFLRTYTPHTQRFESVKAKADLRIDFPFQVIKSHSVATSCQLSERRYNSIGSVEKKKEGSSSQRDAIFFSQGIEVFKPNGLSLKSSSVFVVGQSIKRGKACSSLSLSKSAFMSDDAWQDRQRKTQVFIPAWNCTLFHRKDEKWKGRKDPIPSLFFRLSNYFDVLSFLWKHHHSEWQSSRHVMMMPRIPDRLLRTWGGKSSERSMNLIWKHWLITIPIH